MSARRVHPLHTSVLIRERHSQVEASKESELDVDSDDSKRSFLYGHEQPSPE